MPRKMQRGDLLLIVKRVFEHNRDTFKNSTRTRETWRRLDDTETILTRLINDAPDAALLLDEEEG